MTEQVEDKQPYVVLDIRKESGVAKIIDLAKGKTLATVTNKGSGRSLEELARESAGEAGKVPVRIVRDGITTESRATREELRKAVGPPVFTRGTDRK